MTAYRFSEYGFLIRESDGAFITIPPEGEHGTSAYQDYLAWVAAGNVATPYALPSVTLADAQAAQIEANSAACGAEITGGFTSSAMGTQYTYPSKMTDQQNLNASVVASLLPGLIATWVTPFWCQDSSGKWAYVYHNAAQIQQVGKDAKAAILACLAKNAQLQAQVMACTKVEDVQKITW